MESTFLPVQGRSAKVKRPPLKVQRTIHPRHAGPWLYLRIPQSGIAEHEGSQRGFTRRHRGIDTSKNGDARKVSLTQEARQLLAACIAGKGPEEALVAVLGSAEHGSRRYP
jgi:hypothetical protein